MSLFGAMAGRGSALVVQWEFEPRDQVPRARLLTFLVSAQRLRPWVCTVLGVGLAACP